MRIVVVTAFMLALTGCETMDLGGLGGELGNIAKLADMAGTAKEAFVPASADEEAEIGRESSAVLLGAAPLLNDKKLQAYVNRVGLWVAMQSTRADLPWRFAVLDDPDINAFAAPGGYVFLTKGLLVRLRNEAELAGVLAHEIAHVQARHHLVAIRKQARMKLAGQAIGLAIDDSPEKKQLAAIGRGVKTVYGRGLDRKDEYHADRVGVVLAARAGYDPYGLVAALQTIERVNPDAGEMSLLLKTHPKPADRISRLDTLMQGHFAGIPDGGLGEKRFRDQLRHLASAR